MIFPWNLMISHFSPFFISDFQASTVAPPGAFFRQEVVPATTVELLKRLEELLAKEIGARLAGLSA